MLHVTALKDNMRAQFIKLFKDYYEELGCGDDAEHLADEYVLADYIAGLLKIDIISEDGAPAGFAVYQIDDVTNEWNLKEGWGDVREIYISPSFRGKGLGKFLLYAAEMKLKENGADKAYCLPYEEAIPFFTACGYEKTEVFNGELDCFVYEKLSLDNCECKK